MSTKTPLSRHARHLFSECQRRLLPNDAYAPVYEYNAADALNANRLLGALNQGIKGVVESLNLGGLIVSARDGVRIGELTRHFDSEVFATFSGWLDHSLSFEGWSVAIENSRIGGSFGRLGLSGTSTVQGTISGRSQTDLMSDAIVAVFDTDDFDTVRAVCPSATACRAIVQDYIESFIQTPGGLSWMGEVVDAYREEIAASYACHVSYVSDRLSALLRASVDDRPRCHIRGVQIGRNAILASAIRIGATDWEHLFPIGLVQLLNGQYDGQAIAVTAVEPTGPCEVFITWPKQKVPFFARGTKVRLDGVEVASLGVGQQIAISVPPGFHRLQVGYTVVDLQIDRQQSVRYLTGNSDGFIPKWFVRPFGIPGDTPGK